MTEFARLVLLLGCQATLILGMVPAANVEASPIRLPAAIEGKVVDQQNAQLARRTSASE